MTNVLKGHFRHVDCNTVSVLWLHMCKLCSGDSFTLAKTFTCLSIVLKGYFWYFVWMMSFIVSQPYLVNIPVLFMMSSWPQSFWVTPSFHEMIYPGFICMHTSHIFCQPQICMNDYFARIFFWKGFFLNPCSFSRTTNEADHPWCLFSHGEFLGCWCSNFEIFWSAWRSPMRD